MMGDSHNKLIELRFNARFKWFFEEFLREDIETSFYSLQLPTEKTRIQSVGALTGSCIELLNVGSTE